MFPYYVEVILRLDRRIHRLTFHFLDPAIKSQDD